MTDQLYKDEANRIISLLEKDFLMPNGALCHKITGGRKSSHHILPDLGDVVPFMQYFGRDKLIQMQLYALDSILEEGVLISEFPALKISGLAKSYEYSDFILGLLDIYKKDRNQKNKDRLLFHVEKMTEIFRYDNKISSWYHLGKKLHLPVIDSRDGMMIELYVELYEETRDSRYLVIAKNIAAQLSQLTFYKKHDVFPTLHCTLVPYGLMRLFRIKKFIQADIPKVNTNTLFGFLELYRITKEDWLLEVIDKTVSAIFKKASNKGGIVATYKPGNLVVEANLTASFMLLDFLCDLYVEIKKERYLKYALSIAEFWLDRQTEIGLFPLKASGGKTFLDSETDMTVALYKLYEITSDRRFKESADRCTVAIIKYHGQKDYVLGVDSQTGRVVDNYQKTKFLALFLKLLILKIEQTYKHEIYKNKELFNLLKDR